MAEIPQNLIRAIVKAGITADPSCAQFREVAERVEEIIRQQAREAHRATGKSEAILYGLLIAEVGETTVSFLYQNAEPDRILGSIEVFSFAIRRRASEIITEFNRQKHGSADAPLPPVHERRPIKGTKGKKKF